MPDRRTTVPQPPNTSSIAGGERRKSEARAKSPTGGTPATHRALEKVPSKVLRIATRRNSLSNDEVKALDEAHSPLLCDAPARNAVRFETRLMVRRAAASAVAVVPCVLQLLDHAAVVRQQLGESPGPAQCGPALLGEPPCSFIRYRAVRELQLRSGEGCAFAVVLADGASVVFDAPDGLGQLFDAVETLRSLIDRYRRARAQPAPPTAVVEPSDASEAGGGSARLSVAR